MAEKSSIKVELGDRVAGQIELPKFDVSPYIGQRKKIENVEEREGKYGYFIIVQTEEVTKLGENSVRASRVFALYENDGKIGWGEKTQLGLFLKKMSVSHYRELVGKEVILQSVTSKKDGNDYLTFN